MNIWRCDFCEAEGDSGYGTKRPEDWLRVQMKKLTGNTQHHMIHFDACKNCRDIVNSTFNKELAIDLLKRLHVVATSDKPGDK